MRSKHKYLFVLVLTLCTLQAKEPIFYKGLIRLPAELCTPDGRSVRNGEYEIEIKREKEHYILIFSQKDKIEASVIGERVQAESIELGTAKPWLGTHFLRASTDPVGTEAERHYSKTGRTQYEEEKRTWKASMRTFTFPNDNGVLFLFGEKGDKGQWNTVEFKLSLTSKP